MVQKDHTEYCYPQPNAFKIHPLRALHGDAKPPTQLQLCPPTPQPGKVAYHSLQGRPKRSHLQLPAAKLPVPWSCILDGLNNNPITRVSLTIQYIKGGGSCKGYPLVPIHTGCVHFTEQHGVTSACQEAMAPEEQHWGGQTGMQPPPLTKQTAELLQSGILEFDSAEANNSLRPRSGSHCAQLQSPSQDNLGLVYTP